MNGRVLKSTGTWYDVLGDDGLHHKCRVRGKLRLEGSRETNPVAVGDFVSFEQEGEDASIDAILERRNHMVRQAVKAGDHQQVLAANIDQAVLIATVIQPRTSTGFIDRFLVTADAFDIQPLVIFNKTDLLDEDQQEVLSQAEAIYAQIGVRTVSMSAINEAHWAEVFELFKGKVSLITGHSGAGKSTILNHLAPDQVSQDVGDISHYSNKGKHTTTFAEMFVLRDNTFIIDTPGIKEWGLPEIEDHELSGYFPEMRELRLQCKFGGSCLHHNEPRCAVIEAVEQGRISFNRYKNYLSMLLGEDNRK